uniref:Uncharacterized protein n=1 Tax=Oryza punctata TaxID=4537 RepID=A0A0E0M3V2_ORYPU
MDGGGIAFYYTGVLYDIRFVVPLDRFIAYSSSGVSSDFRRHAEDCSITRCPGSSFAITFVATDARSHDGGEGNGVRYDILAEAAGLAENSVRMRWALKLAR